MDLTLLMETNVVASFGFHPIQWIGQLLGVIMDGIFKVTSAVGIMNINDSTDNQAAKITKIDGGYATRNSSHSKEV